MPEPPVHEPDVIRQRFSVSFEYPVHFVTGLFEPANPLLAGVLDRHHEGRRHRVAVLLDAGLVAAWPDLPQRVNAYAAGWDGAMELIHVGSVPGGEAAKADPAVTRALLDTLAGLGLDRQSFVLAVGGGAMLDAAGFAVSILHRGLRLVRVPTTTLAQNDAGVGVKNGLDAHGQKNFVGTFAVPWAVLNDFDFLPTLAQRDWIGGVAEAFKVALLKDASFFDWLCSHAGALRGRDALAMRACIRRCAALHLEHIRTAGDPFELGSSRPLDFGHWAAHRLEGLSGYALGHGQAVAVGMSLDACYAAHAGLLDANTCDRLLTGLRNAGLPTWDAGLDVRGPDGRWGLLDGLEQFREHIGGRLALTLPHRPGQAVEVSHLDPVLLAQAVQTLRERL